MRALVRCVFVQFRVRMRGMHMGELRLRSDRVNELAHVQLRSRILRTVLLHNFMLFIHIRGRQQNKNILQYFTVCFIAVLCLIKFTYAACIYKYFIIFINEMKSAK